MPVKFFGVVTLRVIFPFAGVIIILMSLGLISILLTVKFPSVFNINVSLYIELSVILMPVRLCFPGVNIAGGVCYFLWDRDYSGDCNITNIVKGKLYRSSRPLNEFDTFIRYSEAVDIVKKAQAYGEPMMDKQVSSRKPFGLDTTVSSIENGDLLLRYNRGLGHYPSNLVTTGQALIPKWKTIISYASYDHAGQLDKDGMRKVMSVIEVLPPNSVCTETYLIAGAFNSEEEATNLQQYFGTKFVRFLVAQIAVSQHITKGCFAFVPNQDFTKAWTDQDLYEKYHLTESEIAFIESMIRPM